MSASNKKKLRKEQTADMLTAKQQKEQSEAKKMKIYTISFLAVMIAIVCIAAGILGIRAVNNSGIIQKNTIAAKVGDRELNTVELSYYYIDAINNFHSQWYEYYGDNTDEYLKAMGLDTKVALDKQICDTESGQTWAEYFVDAAISQAANDYAMYDLAMGENYKLSEDEKAAHESNLTNIKNYATISGYNNPDLYLRAVYGFGSTLETYSAYSERSMIAKSYYAAQEDTFVYTEEERNKYAEDKKETFDGFTYDSCYMSYTYFREGGTENADGQKTYTDAENQAARDKMTAAANKLATATSVEQLKELVKNTTVNEGSTISVTENKNTLYSSINIELAKWLAAEDRKNGDIAAIPNNSTITGEDGKETTVTNGYYVAIFNSRSDNTTPMADIGQMFVPYEGEHNHEDETSKHSPEEIANAKKAAEGYLAQWNEGEKTIASFEKLASSLIAEEKIASGGLAENVNPGSNINADILAWSLNAERKPGDTTIIEADDGFYILCYSKLCALNYRQYMIDTEMRAADYEAWYKAIIDKVTTSVENTSKMDLDITLGG